MKIKISVILSTYNRAGLLKDCLSSLVNQSASNSLYEIIVVDNNSKDNTKHVINNFINRFPELNIHYIKEKRQGLSHARNTGCKNARGKYLAYIDDDAKAPKNWIINIVKTIDNIKPDILGGPIYPYYSCKKPVWFKDEYEIRSHGETAKFLRGKERLSGSNFIIKKNLLKKLGMFNPNLGMTGNKLRYGEETKLMLDARNIITNVTIYYTPELKIKHMVKMKNFLLLYRMKSKFIAGMQKIDVYGKQDLSKFRFFLNINIAFLKIIFLLIFGYFFRNKDKYYYFENFVYERILPQISELARNLRGFLSANNIFFKYRHEEKLI